MWGDFWPLAAFELPGKKRRPIEGIRRPTVCSANMHHTEARKSARPVTGAYVVCCAPSGYGGTGSVSGPERRRGSKGKIDPYLKAGSARSVALLTSALLL